MRWRFFKVEKYLPTITYIAGYICCSTNKRLKCICCKRPMLCHVGDVHYIEASFNKSISWVCLVFPSPEMVRIALMSYLVFLRSVKVTSIRSVLPSGIFMTIAIGLGSNRSEYVLFFQWARINTARIQAGADTGGVQGMHPPNQPERGLDMTLDFVENHRQNIFVLHIT